MEAGVQNAECLIAIFTNNGKDSYLSRAFCRQEIRWAEQYHKPIVAVVSRDDKKNVGKFVEEGIARASAAPSFGRLLGFRNIMWYVLLRSTFNIGSLGL